VGHICFYNLARRRLAGEKSVRAWQCVALNTNGRATIHGFSLGGCHRRARTPTLMLRPNGLAPARHHWFANVPLGVPFATPARESRRALLECHRANPPGHDIQRLSGAQVSAGKPRRCATRQGSRERGQLSFLCVTRNSPPSLPKTGNGLTPRPSVCAPGYVAPRVALVALRPTLRQITGESA